MRFWVFACSLLSVFFTVACQTQPNQIFIEVDSARQTLTTDVTTVREALAEAEINLGPLDRVAPDLYVQLEQGMTIVVTRVTEEIEVELPEGYEPSTFHDLSGMSPKERVSAIMDLLED